MSKGLVTTFAVGTLLTTLLMGVSSAEASDKAFRKCAACHSIEEGGKNKVGPNLWNIMNRGAGVADYKYSKAFTKFAEENPMWTSELMDAWLENSKGLIKGTKMNFKERKEEKRQAIIDYLTSMGE